MIDIKRLSENPDFYKKASKTKGLNQDSLIDEIIQAYQKYLTLLKENQVQK